MSDRQRTSAAAAADRVRAVLEAAEQSAADLRAEAAREIEAQLATARTVTERLSTRADEIERALQSLSDTVRDELTALKADLEELRAVGERVDETPAPATEPAPDQPEPEPEPELAAAAAPQPAADGNEGARVIALNMALGGSSREETARYLSENFDLADADALLDEVYARVGRS